MEGNTMPVVPYYPSENPEPEDPPDVDGIIEDILHPNDDVPAARS